MSEPLTLGNENTTYQDALPRDINQDHAITKFEGFEVAIDTNNGSLPPNVEQLPNKHMANPITEFQALSDQAPTLENDRTPTAVGLTGARTIDLESQTPAYEQVYDKLKGLSPGSDKAIARLGFGFNPGAEEKLESFLTLVSDVEQENNIRGPATLHLEARQEEQTDTTYNPQESYLKLLYDI